MNSLFTITILLIMSGCLGHIQPDRNMDSAEVPQEPIYDYQEYITEDFLLRHLNVIAHDSLEGREAGMPGQKKAARYLSSFYETLGFTPLGNDGYLQHFMLNAEQTDSLVFTTYRSNDPDSAVVNHSKLAPGFESQFLRLYGGTLPQKGDIVFAGFGVNDTSRAVNHLKGTTLAGKWVLIFNEIPHIVNNDTLIGLNITSQNRIDYILNQTGAVGVIGITNDSQQEFDYQSGLTSALINKPRSMRLAYLDTSTRTPVRSNGYMQISPELATTLLDLERIDDLWEFQENITADIHNFEAYDLEFGLDYRPYSGTREIQSENVAALLEGSDPELSEEVIVLMAHYDHIGLTQPDANGDMINNGADDDGSGTVSLMSVANALNLAAENDIRPDRSILFLHVSAEEKGLLGSRYYSDHPLIPIENTVASYNIDMVSRSDAQHLEQGETDYVYIIGGNIISSDLDSLVHSANNMHLNMQLDYGYNDLQDPNQFYRRSDHWNLGRLGVPFVFFFTGVHEDYHRPSDHVEKVNLSKLSRVSRLVYSSTIKVANVEEIPVVDNQEFIDITRNQPR